MSDPLPTSGDSEPRPSFGAGELVSMMTVGQLRAIVADPALLDSHLVVIATLEPEGWYRHIETWDKPHVDGGYSALTFHPGEPLDTRDF